MPLSTDNFIQIKTGSFEGTSGSATLDAAATAGSTILIAAGLDGDGVATPAISTPAGFGMALTTPAANSRSKPYLFMKQAAAGGETSFTLAVTGGAARQVCWAVFEATGIDVAEDFASSGVNGIFLQNPSQPLVGGATLEPSLSTDVSESSESFSAMAMAIHVGVSADTTVPVLDGHTNGFSEVAAVNRANATRAMALSVSARPSYTVETFETTASSAPDSYLACALVAFTAVDAYHAVRVQTCSGAEIGTATSVTNTSIVVGEAMAPWDGVAGSPAAVTSTPRTGSYCWEMSSSAAAECLTWSANNLNMGFGIGSAQSVDRLHIYFPSALPSTDLELFSVEAGSLANGVQVWYRTATQKLGVKIGTGTEQASDAVVAAGQWIGIDLKYDPSATTHTCDWQVDYDATPGDATGPVVQTQATASGMSAAVVSLVRAGWSTSRTATVRYDDIVHSRHRKNYPIGDVNIRPLKVDPAGTPVVVGTTANFQSFTSNGTGAAFNAATVRNALTDIPPVIGAASDGLMQITAAGSDYVRIPMETYTAAPDHVLRAIRWYAALWAASGTAATSGMSFHDGTAEVGFVSVADHGFDSTALLWVCRPHRPPGTGFYLLNQAKVDALEARFGKSGDATPDVGLHAVLAELVTQPAVVLTLTEAEDGTFRVYVRQDPVTGAMASLVVTTPPGSRGATLTTTISAVDAEDYVGPDTMWEKSIGASDITEVTSVGLRLDPT